MEEGVFRDPAVSRELQQFVEARLHTDGSGEERSRIAAKNRALQLKMVKSTSNPIFVVVSVKTGRRLGIFPGATRDPKEFAAFLKATLKNA